MNGQHHFLSIDNCKIHVEEVGEGKPLLLIHGLGGSLMFQRVIEPLSKHFRVLVLDLPGFGDSESSGKSFSTNDHAEFVAQVLQHFSFDKTILVGISYGGQVAATFASNYPECVERLALVCSTGLVQTSFIISNKLLWKVFSFLVKQFVLTNQTLLCKLGSRSFYDIASRPKDLCKKFFEQLSKPGHREAWLNCFYNVFTGGEEFNQRLKEVQTPTLILWGENDITVKPEFGKEFQRLIPNSSFQIFSECVHSVPLEKPEEFVEAVIAFCNS